MSERSTRWIAGIAMFAMLVAACSSTGANPSASVDPTAPARSPTGSIPAGTEQPTAAGIGSPVTSAAAGPPTASLGAEGGDRVVGQLGSFTWKGAGSDSPWLPGSPIRVGSGEPLTVTITGSPSIGSWTARRIPAGATDGNGAIAMGSGEGDPIGFLAPDSGRWSIVVDVRFAAGSDAAAYSWLLDVR